MKLKAFRVWWKKLGYIIITKLGTKMIMIEKSSQYGTHKIMADVLFFLSYRKGELKKIRARSLALRMSLIRTEQVLETYLHVR